jgi:hypothetical protein
MIKNGLYKDQHRISRPSIDAVALVGKQSVRFKSILQLLVTAD